MPTYLVGPSRAYTTISSAKAAIPTNLSATGIHNIIVDSGIYSEGAQLYFDSFSNASSTDYIVLSAASGSEHFGDPNQGVRISFNAQVGNSQLRTGSYMRLYNIVVKDGIGGANNQNILSSGRCIFRNVLSLSTTGGTAFYCSSNDIYINCFAMPAAYNTKFSYGFRPSANTEMYNCESFGHNYGFDGSFGTSAIIKNCRAIKHSTGTSDFYTVNPWIAANNMSSDNTVKGTNSLSAVPLSAFGYYSPATLDFRVTANSLGLGRGVDLSSLFTSDVGADLITSWMIGFDFLYIPPPTFVINKYSGTIPMYITLTDTTNMPYYTSANPAYTRIWSITNINTSAANIFTSTSATTNYCISAGSILGDTYTISLSAVF